MIDFIICIGNGSEFADSLAKDIATRNNLKHYGFLDHSIELLSGCYHTSIYDIKSLELVNKVTTVFDRLKIVVLDQGENFYKNTRDYHDTIEMAQVLVPHCEVEFVNPAMSNPFKQLMKENKSFCILPFISIRNNNSHCCWMKKFNNYTDFYTDKNSIKMRQQLLAGEKTNLCQQCYNVEEYGAISRRQSLTQDWTYRLNLKSYNEVEKYTKLIRYEIQLGNYCNLMCRMCDPRSSSLIDVEYSNLGLAQHKLGVTKNNQFDNVDLNSVQQIIVAGGEPSINQDFYDFLKRCIQENKTDFEIFIATNAVSITKEFISLIKQFTNIKISISVDGFDKTNQYIRWPSDWEKFKQNVQKLISALPPHNYYFNSVVSIYNITCLYPLFKFLDENYSTSAFSINLLETPEHQAAWNFPNKQLVLDDLKKIKTLKKYHTDEVFNSNINGIIQRVETCKIDYVTLSKFFEFNDLLDQSRGVKLADYIPELEQCRSYLTNIVG
jgi:molybdenum cofactor biosynthesis enzyme MoaA